MPPENVEGTEAPVETAPSEDFAGSVPEDGGAELNFGEINNILSFDPFAEAEDDGATGDEEAAALDATATETTEEETSTTVVDDPNMQEASEEETVTTPEEAPVESPELALLRQQLEVQQQLIAQLQKGEAEAKPTPEGEDDSSAPAVPDYQFTIPDQLMALLDSEDPAERRQGLGAMATGLAQTVHAQMLEQVQGMFTQVVPKTVMGVIEQQNTSKAIFEDFYGTHKDLNRPELRPIIVQEAEAVFKASGQQGWTPEVRDAIANRVRAILGTAKAAPAAPSKPKPPAQPIGGRQSRGSLGDSTPDSVQQDIARTLGFG